MASRWTCVAAAICVGVAAGCTRDRATPTTLVDGSRAQPAPIDFDGVDGPVVMTAVRRLRQGARCGLAGTPDGVTVLLLGVSGASVVTRSQASGTVRSCDGTTPGRWCGRAFARMRPGRQLDPRLSLTCRGSNDQVDGFAWLDPSTNARYLVITHDHYAEAYDLIAGSRVRVTTGDVGVNTSSAHFDVSEHAADGRRIAAYRLVAQVSD